MMLRLESNFTQVILLVTQNFTQTLGSSFETHGRLQLTNIRNGDSISEAAVRVRKGVPTRSRDTTIYKNKVGR